MLTIEPRGLKRLDYHGEVRTEELFQTVKTVFFRIFQTVGNDFLSPSSFTLETAASIQGPDIENALS